jgi:hypothetical protein
MDLEKRGPSESISHDKHHDDNSEPSPLGLGLGTEACQSEILQIQEGTFYQSKTAQRQGFLKRLFSPLERACMDAVHQDAEGVVYEEGGEEERRIKKKVDNRILPLIILSFICESAQNSGEQGSNITHQNGIISASRWD